MKHAIISVGRLPGRWAGLFQLTLGLAILSGLFLRPLWAGGASATSPGQAMVADQLANLAWQATMVGQQPVAESLKASGMLLDLALAMDPSQAELWESKRELARQQQDSASDLAALKNYIRLRPDDDAAQLEFFFLSVAGQQTVEQRIQTMEQVLGSAKAGVLSAALRSRLASYVAQGAREIGDSQRLAKWLQQALALDTSNAAAAQMLVELVKEKPQASASELGLAWLTMVQAKPLDPAARRELAGVLLDAGLVDLANQQYAVTQFLSQNALLEPSLYHDWVVALICDEQYDAAAGLLDSLEKRLAQESAAGADKAKEDQAAAQPAQPPAAMEMPVDLQVLRLVALTLAGKEEARQAAVGKLNEAFEKQPQASRDWLGIRMVLEPKADWQLPADLNQTATGQRILGWYHLQQQQADKARELLTPLASQDALAAYGLAKLAPAGEQQNRQLRVIAAGPVRSLATILAKADLARAQARYYPSDAVAATLKQVYKSKAPSLLQPANSLKDWLRWSIQAPQSVGYLQPLVMRVRVTNQGPVALAISPSGPVLPYGLLAVEVRLAGSLIPSVQPTLVQMNQALSIQPGQTLEIPIRLDRQQIGLVLADAPGVRATLSGRVMLAAAVDNSTGQMAPSWLTGTSVLPVMGREPAAAATMPLEKVIALLNQPDLDEASRFQAVGSLMTALPLLWAGPGKEESRPLLTQALPEFYAKAAPVMQGMMAMGLRSGMKGETLLEPIHQAALGSSEPWIRMAYIASQITDPDSPALVKAISEKQPPVSDFAQAWQKTIQAIQEAKKAQAQAMEEARAHAAAQGRSGKQR